LGKDKAEADAYAQKELRHPKEAKAEIEPPIIKR